MSDDIKKQIDKLMYKAVDCKGKSLEDVFIERFESIEKTYIENLYGWNEIEKALTDVFKIHPSAQLCENFIFMDKQEMFCESNVAGIKEIKRVLDKNRKDT